MDIIATLASELNLKPQNVEAAVKLIDEGSTIPFIARYRKEATGGMDDVAAARRWTSGWPTCATLEAAQGRRAARSSTSPGQAHGRAARRRSRRPPSAAARGGPVQAVPEEARDARLRRRARRGSSRSRCIMIVMQAATNGVPRSTLAAPVVTPEAGRGGPTTRPRPRSLAPSDIVAESARRRRGARRGRCATFTRRQRLSIAAEATDPDESAPSTSTYYGFVRAAHASIPEPPRSSPSTAASSEGRSSGCACALTPAAAVDAVSTSAMAGADRASSPTGAATPPSPTATSASWHPALEREAARRAHRARADGRHPGVRPERGKPALGRGPCAERASSRSTRGTAPGCKVAVLDEYGASCSTTAVVFPTKPRHGCRGHQARARAPTCGRYDVEHHRHRQRHGQPGDRGGGLRVHRRVRARPALHHRQRGGRVGLLRLRAGERVSTPTSTSPRAAR